jgi:hypothetical protein
LTKKAAGIGFAGKRIGPESQNGSLRLKARYPVEKSIRRFRMKPAGDQIGPCQGGWRNRPGPGQTRPGKIFGVLDIVDNPRLLKKAAITEVRNQGDPGLGEREPEEMDGRCGDQQVAQTAPPYRDDRVHDGRETGGRMPAVFNSRKGKILVLGRMKVFSSRHKKTLSEL